MAERMQKIAPLGLVVALKSICKQGVPLLITQLREQLMDQDVGTGDDFLIGTSDDFEVGGEGEGEAGGKACRLYDESPTCSRRSSTRRRTDSGHRSS